MNVLYCLNPDCKKPENTTKVRVCQNCGSSLVLHKRYVAIKKIGRGGFGVTFLAVDLGNNKSYCVIKQLLTVGQDEKTAQTALDLFEREANTLDKINHPQIPKLLDYFEEKKQFYLIQEFVLGQDLEREIRKKGVFSQMTAIRFLKEMLPVLDYIHSQKVIHRDIKPGNILRRKDDGALILIDFGAVKDQVNTQLMKSSPQSAFTQISVGTMGFAPPEQLAMRPRYSSDIYALGATCIYLLTGKAPKDLCDETTGELAWEKQTSVNSNLANVLNKMLELNIKKRYDSAKEVLNALDIMNFEKDFADSMVKKTSVIEEVEEDNTSITTAANTSQNLAAAIKQRQERKKVRLPVKAMIAPVEQKPTNIKWSREMLLTEYGRGNRNFSQQDLRQIDLESVKLSGASFSQSKLIGTNFEKATLLKTNFYNANLAQANLKGADLQQADLFRANLKSADLQNASLQEANLDNALLKDANLCGANLKGAKVDEQQLKEAKTNWKTIYPNGKRRWW